MPNFTPDDIFRSTFDKGGSIIPNDDLWRKLENQLIKDNEKRNAEKKRKRALFIYSSSVAALLLLSTGYISLVVFNDTSHKNIAKTQTTNTTKKELVLDNNSLTNKHAKTILNDVTTSSNSFTTKSLVTKNELLSLVNNKLQLQKINLQHTIIANTNKTAVTIPTTADNESFSTLNDALANDVDVKRTLISQELLSVANNSNYLINNSAIIAAKPISMFRKPSIGHVANGLFIGASVIKSQHKALGYNIQIQHHKAMNNQTTLVSGGGFLQLPMEYKYKKVAPKEGLPQNLDAKLYQLNIAYAQFGVQYFPSVLNKNKPSIGFAFYAMPGIITNVKASTNAGDPTVDRKMERQINRSYFAAGLGISKSITPKLWLELGGTYSFSTLTNAVFLNKTNAINNIVFTQAGLKYKF